VVYLTLDEVLVIHQRLVERFGGELGVTDPGRLESALYRPQTPYYGDLVERAAALFESLLMNHPFVDGNKRVAFFATDTFLRLNGWRLDAEAPRAHAFIADALSSGRSDLAQWVKWIRGMVVRLPGPR
jgi:death-on-curing protein